MLPARGRHCFCLSGRTYRSHAAAMLTSFRPCTHARRKQPETPLKCPSLFKCPFAGCTSTDEYKVLVYVRRRTALVSGIAAFEYDSSGGLAGTQHHVRSYTGRVDLQCRALNVKQAQCYDVIMRSASQQSTLSPQHVTADRSRWALCPAASSTANDARG